MPLTSFPTTAPITDSELTTMRLELLGCLFRGVIPSSASCSYEAGGYFLHDRVAKPENVASSCIYRDVYTVCCELARCTRVSWTRVFVTADENSKHCLVSG